MIDAENSEKKQEETSEDEDEPYEVIETPGASGKDLLSELISMDLVHRTPLQQIGIGGLSGWLVGTLCKKVGKMTMSAVGGGLFIIQGYNYAKRNVAAAGGFVAGFLLGVAL